MPTVTHWVVTTSGQQPLPAIAQQLTQAGFAVEQLLEAIGCVTGTATAAVAAQVRTIPGVTDVSPEAPISLGPPGATTW